MHDTMTTQPQTGAKWPSEISQKAVTEALSDVPALAEWPEGVTFHDAPDVEALGALIVPKLHKHLNGHGILFVYREKLSFRGSPAWAIASKLSAKDQWLLGVERKRATLGPARFLLTVNWEVWHGLDLLQKCALVDHELAHMGLEERDDELASVMIPHDLEEFVPIVARWGNWRRAVSLMGAAMAQLELGLVEQ